RRGSTCRRLSGFFGTLDRGSHRRRGRFLRRAHWNPRVVGSHELAAPGGEPAIDPRHRAHRCPVVRHLPGNSRPGARRRAPNCGVGIPRATRGGRAEGGLRLPLRVSKLTCRREPRTPDGWPDLLADAVADEPALPTDPT